MRAGLGIDLSDEVDALRKALHEEVGVGPAPGRSAMRFFSERNESSVTVNAEPFGGVQLLVEAELVTVAVGDDERKVSWPSFRKLAGSTLQPFSTGGVTFQHAWVFQPFKADALRKRH